MKKINTSPISGMQELLPSEQATFNKMKQTISDVYTRHGFLNIETPVIDRCEVLLAKAGGDTEKQIYKVIKTAETNDDADQALRFDHTVPLARYVVEHENDLSFPFKVSQIGRNYRGERAQKGRFREFYQCDVDVIGRGDLPLYYDVDVISTLLDVFDDFKLGTPILARINNRKILSGLLEALGISELSEDVFSIVDHSEKQPLEKTEASLKEIGLSDEIVSKLMSFIDIHGQREDVANRLQAMNIENEKYLLGVNELTEVMRMLELDGKADQIEADMKIVRGLDYYTGTVFEFVLPEYREVGSVCGGGRYENLAGYFTEQKLPGVGGSIGLTRLFFILMQNGLVRKQDAKPIEYAIIPLGKYELEYALEVAKELRNGGSNVMIVSSEKHLGDKMKYASKIAEKAIIIGEDEVKLRQYEVKTFTY